MPGDGEIAEYTQYYVVQSIANNGHKNFFLAI